MKSAYIILNRLHVFLPAEKDSPSINPYRMNEFAGTQPQQNHQSGKDVSVKQNIAQRIAASEHEEEQITTSRAASQGPGQKE